SSLQWFWTYIASMFKSWITSFRCLSRTALAFLPPSIAATMAAESVSTAIPNTVRSTGGLGNARLPVKLLITNIARLTRSFGFNLAKFIETLIVVAFCTAAAVLTVVKVSGAGIDMVILLGEVLIRRLIVESVSLS